MKNWFIVAVLVVGCTPPTPAQDVQILKAELAIASTKCAVYTLNPKYPRDVVVTEKCDKLVKP